MKKLKTLLFALVLSGMLGTTLTGCVLSGDDSNSVSDSTPQNASSELDNSSETDASSEANSSSDSIVDSSDEKAANEIVTLSIDGELFCGMAAPQVTATATYGTPTITFAKADGEADKEELVYRAAAELEEKFFKDGTFYVKASVEGTEEYQGAVKYVEFTLAHLTYEAIEGEAVETVAPDKTSMTKGYSVKYCTCGAEVKGEYTVLVSVEFCGGTMAEETLQAGGSLTTLPTREGYTLKLYNDGGEVALNATFDDVVILTARWVYTESDYDYRADAEAKIAVLPTEATAENAEDVLTQIASIENIVDAHYTEAEKATLPASVTTLKEAAEAIIHSVSYQLDKKLAAIPEIADMTDESATLLAVLDYVAYVNGLSSEELGDYSEPIKISIYKNYFSGSYALVENLNVAVETNAYKGENGDLVLDGVESNEYNFTFPKMPYSLIKGAKTIAYFGEANLATGYTLKAYGETLVDAASKPWFWIEVITDDTGSYLSIYDTDNVFGAKVALPESVVNGEEGLTFTVAIAGEWDWMKFRQDGSIETDNFYGEIAEFTDKKTVYTATFNYTDNNGAQTITQYYLPGETLAAPELSVSYTDKVGSHTFLGWGETADTVNENLVYSAVYETVYEEYSVTFLDADYNVFEEKSDYHYGDKLVLPTTTPEKANEGDWSFAFIGWYSDDVLVTSETAVEKNMEIEPRFQQVYAGACYTVTIESEGLETQTYSIPTLSSLQAEAIAKIPVALERANYTFIGYTDKASGDEVDIGAWTEVNADTTLVANWEAAHIAMAAALPMTVAEITDENQTYANLVAYIAHVEGDYTEEELDGYEDPANVVALKEHYAGVRKIYTFTATDDSNVATNARFEAVKEYGETWFQDDYGNAYGGYIQATFDLGDGVSTVTLPKIKFNAYKEVSFGLSILSSGKATLTLNGVTSPTLSESEAQNFYTVVIKDGAITVHSMNNVADVKLTSTLTDAQKRGVEGLVLSVEESGWTCAWISHIHGELKGAVVAEASMEASLLAKLPADTASITDEEATYDDLVAYLSYVRANAGESYVEPANVTALKAYYAGSRVLVSGMITSVTTNANYEAQNGLILTGASDSTYTFTLPKICFGIYSEVSCITVFGGANSGYTFSAYGTTFVNTSSAWNWLKVVKVGAEGKTVKNTTGADLVLSEGYYLTIGNTDVGSEWYKYVKLSDAVVNGEESLTFSVKTADGNWDWLKFRQDGSVETDNLVGALA